MQGPWPHIADWKRLLCQNEDMMTLQSQYWRNMYGISGEREIVISRNKGLLRHRGSSWTYGRQVTPINTETVNFGRPRINDKQSHEMKN